MKVHHISLNVNNLEESIGFYTKFFGFKFINQYRKEKQNITFCYLSLNDFQIELFCFEKQKENIDDLEDLSIRGIRHIAFEVDDIDKSIKELKEKGLTFPDAVIGSSGNKFSLGKDINGIQIELIQILNK